MNNILFVCSCIMLSNFCPLNVLCLLPVRLLATYFSLQLHIENIPLVKGKKEKTQFNAIACKRDDIISDGCSLTLFYRIPTEDTLCVKE